MRAMNAASDTTTVDHISREAGDKTKGFRFQKLRAAIRFLQRVETNQNGQIQCALEFLEDSVVLGSNEGALISGEENKYYGSRLSFNSAAIRNTVVAFLDLYFTFSRSKELKLAVYASAELSQERISAERREKLGYGAKQQHYEILKKLVAGDDLAEEEIQIAFSIAQEEYFSQYKDATKGYRALVESMSSTEFLGFIKSIEWSISNETNESLEDEALSLIKGCRFFSHRHEHLEGYILSTLLDELEKRSGRKGIIDRLMSTDTLKNIFNDILIASAKDERSIDPAADDWSNIKANDFRNLAEKIYAVSPGFSPAVMGVLARKCSLARSVEPEGQREMKALLRRILDVCEEELICMSKSSSMSQQDILNAIEDLTKASKKHLATLRQLYRYRTRDQHAIKGAVLTLFDDCFLAFDEVKNDA